MIIASVLVTGEKGKGDAELSIHLISSMNLVGTRGGLLA